MIHPLQLQKKRNTFEERGREKKKNLHQATISKQAKEDILLNTQAMSFGSFM